MKNLLLSCQFFAPGLANYKRPHVVFILADDLGWDDVGWANEKVNTPVLDKLRENSIELDQYYVQQVCTPSRAALMTGKSCSKWAVNPGILDRNQWIQKQNPVLGSATSVENLSQGLIENNKKSPMKSRVAAFRTRFSDSGFKPIR